MTAAFNLSQLANNLNSSGQLDATDGLNGLVANANLASSGTASSSTFLRGDRAWVAISQKLVQVVQSTYTTQNTTTTNTGSYANVFSASITPTASSSTILVWASVDADSYLQSGSRSSIWSWIALFRNGTGGTLLQSRVIGGDTSGFGVGGAIGAAGHSFLYYDSPATTSATTYNIGIKCRSDTSDITTRVNGSSVDTPGGTPYSTIILLEVAA